MATKAGLRTRHELRCSSMHPGTPTSLLTPGLDYELAGELDPAQTLTTTFRMANVDHERRKTITKDALHALDGGGSRVG